MSTPMSTASDQMSSRRMSFAEAILDATDLCMANDTSVFIMGLGVPDPKGIFGTTMNLHTKYGSERVFDCPVSENAMTGVAIGAATSGMRPIMTHQRVDFALLSLDQIINNAAKWHFMFGGRYRAPIVIRMIIGRGWGQGPQHSQSLQALFAHIPGLKVVMPANPTDAKGLLVSAIEDDSPVIYIEHRWLHNVVAEVPAGVHREPIGKARVTREGKDVSIIATSYMVPESFRAAEHLAKVGIEAEVIDVRTVKPFDGETFLQSVRKTGRLIVADTGHLTCGFASEVVAYVTERVFSSLKSSPLRVTLPDYPVPTSPALSAHCYPRSHHLAEAVGRMLDRDVSSVVKELQAIEGKVPADVPDLNFTGPF